MNSENKKRGSFSGSLGFILAAAGSAVGLGNLWRFPYVCAKDGGGLFVFLYIILAITFGFALITSEIAIGRKTRMGPLEAYKSIHPKFGFLGWFATIIPIIIFPYYCVIGGWVTRYGVEYVGGLFGSMAVTGETASDFFSNFITAQYEPILYLLIFIVITAIVVFLGVDKGIEKVSKVLMPALLLLIIGIAIYSMTLSFTDENGTTRTAIEGLGVYLIPDFSKITFSSFMTTLLDVSGQMFYSLSIAMGIMIAYGSYAPKDSSIVKSVNQIEIFDTAVALIAGVIIIPCVYVFQGQAGLAASGPSLMFVSLPQVFSRMGTAGIVIGALFFILVFFAALTSSISLMEAVVSSVIDRFKVSRKVATVIVLVISLVIGVVVCLGYNLFYFELKLPNGSVGQILDIFDYLSNNVLMPIVALITCLFVGWIVKPDLFIEEINIGLNGKFRRKGLYVVMIKYVCPIILFIILLSSFGIFG